VNPRECASLARMEPSFWIDSWREGRIRFHEGKPNAFLTRHLARIPGGRVLVPMCGKSEDLAYLAGQGREVVGIELVEDAVRSFFTEHAITPTITRRGELAIYRASSLTLIAGDLFAVAPETVGTIDAIYDRAALIALPAALRRRYVEHVRTLAPATRGLLITLEHAGDGGPPFSVPEPEVRTLYAELEHLETQPDSTGRFGEGAVERCFAIRL
jgi:thiopurine S-methyltransferase